MNVKSAFLNGYINEEVYVEQPSGFEDDKKPDHVLCNALGVTARFFAAKLGMSIFSLVRLVLK
jgi:hypothetical protein